MSPFDVAGLRKKLEEIDQELQKDGLWDDPEAAQKIMREKKSAERKLADYEKLEEAFSDIEVLIEMAEEEDDASVAEEITESFASLKNDMETLRLQTLLNGEYDANNAIISIHAGSGGVDAQDWAGMLLRMYTRWAESKGYRVKTLDLQRDDEEGIKNATLLIEGENAYGYLKNERGVHRLVRISPFDSNARRHTSFASLDVSPEINDDVTVEIAPEDIRIDTYRSSGAGGPARQYDRFGGADHASSYEYRRLLSERAFTAPEQGSCHEGADGEAHRTERAGEQGAHRRAERRLRTDHLG